MKFLWDFSPRLCVSAVEIALPDSATLKKWACLDSATGAASAEAVRKHHLPDFSNWQPPPPLPAPSPGWKKICAPASANKLERGVHAASPYERQPAEDFRTRSSIRMLKRAEARAPSHQFAELIRRQPGGFGDATLGDGVALVAAQRRVADGADRLSFGFVSWRVRG